MFEAIQAILFGVLQGLTEFFPVSSTAHLVLFEDIARKIWGAAGPLTEAQKSAMVVQTVAVHLGTTLAVLILFYREVIDILKECPVILRKAFVERKPLEAVQGAGHVPIIVAIVIATLPTGIIGLVLKKSFEWMLSSPGAVGIALAVTGVVLWATRWFDRSRGGASAEAGCKPLTMFRAFIMGIAQGIAVTPGISRSGATISTGLFLGLERETAGKFSFLLSVPAVLAANLLELKDVKTLGAVQIHNIIGATIAAAVVGYICLRLVMPIIKRGRFYFFAYYCWFAAIAALILSCL